MNQHPDELGFASPLPACASLANSIFLHLWQLCFTSLFVNPSLGIAVTKSPHPLCHHCVIKILGGYL